jgi:EAL and modified HD-GYP domain-containing signal transduction protein
MFIARQAIYTKNHQIYGYELLYRKGIDSRSYGGVAFTDATASIILSMIELGFNKIVDNKKAFINFD